MKHNIKIKLKKLTGYLVPLFSWFTWRSVRALFNHGIYYNLRDDDWDEIRTKLSANYYVILTRSNGHLSNYLVSLGTWLLTGKRGYWGHALMNLEDSTKPDINTGFKLIEATKTGVHFSSFYEVFRCDSAALLKPKGIAIREWTAIFEKLLQEKGKKYDNFMDLMNDKEINCVELVRTALQTLPDYEKRFANLEAMIQMYDNNLTPDMLYNCKDFVVVFEVRR